MKYPMYINCKVYNPVQENKAIESRPPRGQSEPPDTGYINIAADNLCGTTQTSEVILKYIF